MLEKRFIIRSEKLRTWTYLSKVTGQLIRSRKSPVTIRPLALVRSLSSVKSLMSFKMGTFGVGFVAVFKVAKVNSSPLQVWIVSPVKVKGRTTS
jgi:hypothetical protein